MKKTLIDLIIDEIFPCYIYNKWLLKHGLFRLKVVNDWSSYFLKIALTILGVSSSTIDANLNTLRLKVIEIP